jgi:hypothetical protein
MLKPKIGFVVYGVHKDGLQDPMGQPFIDETLLQTRRAHYRLRAQNWSWKTWSLPPSAKPESAFLNSKNG